MDIHAIGAVPPAGVTAFQSAHHYDHREKTDDRQRKYRIKPQFFFRTDKHQKCNNKPVGNSAIFLVNVPANIPYCKHAAIASLVLMIIIVFHDLAFSKPVLMCLPTQTETA
jgi:hypothetical protein